MPLRALSVEVESLGLSNQSAVERLDAAVDHAGDFAQFSDQFQASFLGDVTQGLGAKYLGACFSCGTFRIAQELLELGLSNALGAFGDVVGDTVPGASDLILEAPITTVGQQTIERDAYGLGAPPDLQLLEGFFYRFHAFNLNLSLKRAFGCLRPNAQACKSRRGCLSTRLRCPGTTARFFGSPRYGPAWVSSRARA